MQVCIVRSKYPFSHVSFLGEEGSVIIGKIEESNDFNYGFDAAEGVYGDLVKKGIIDPLKVTSCFSSSLYTCGPIGCPDSPRRRCERVELDHDI